MHVMTLINFAQCHLWLIYKNSHKIYIDRHTSMILDTLKENLSMCLLQQSNLPIPHTFCFSRLFMTVYFFLIRPVVATDGRRIWPDLEINHPQHRSAFSITDQQHAYDFSSVLTIMCNPLLIFFCNTASPNITTDRSYNWRIHGEECVKIAIPFNWPPCEWTLTLPNSPRLCWLSAIILFQTCGNKCILYVSYEVAINIFYMYLNFIKASRSKLNSQ